MYRTTPCWFKYVMMYMCTAMRKWLTNCGLYVYIWCHDVAMALEWGCWSFDQPLAWLK
ncbi:hypothetical protein F383_08513 [Gossypium arboreum]|uniref:Uncharacterized protein n=1 Tax=Gossypium arboreum TaxID=29729 RepID=A0A0B0NCE9_GOSAR|nr:hypothetical protein F383_08513 [Gossypium arboreum]